MRASVISAAVLAFSVALGGVSAAQGAAPTAAAAPSPASTELARLMLPTVITGMRQAEVKPREGMPPEWAPLLQESMVEEVQANPGPLIALLARGFERQFTPAELQAGGKLLASPTGRKMMSQVQAGKTTLDPTAEEQQFMLRWLGEPGAGPFPSKMGGLKPEQFLDREEMAAAIMPAVLARFAAKIGRKPAAKTR